jgi:signal transduction histidine kinase/CheY-like chemotaxis protein/HPt (histidine-containing phosphotransfer) domain-containing protein
MNLLSALGYVIFERIAEGSFRLVDARANPDWLPAGPVTEAFPFLEVFLPDAEEFWANRGNRPLLHSDLWTQNVNGNELHFCGIAVAAERNFLLIECADQRFRQTQSFVQYAHEASLARDEIAKLSRQLERATQAKSEFLARMSHEIRTPLNALLGMAELLSETPLNDKQRRYVKVVRSAGDGLLNVINDILDFSKVEAGEVELENIRFDLTQVLAEALAIARVAADAKGLAVTSRIQSGVPRYLTGDPGRLRQILINLLGNAAKFTERGEIGVLVEANPEQPVPGSLHFAISDTGIGIPPDRLSAIFDSFSQADASTSRKFGGTGLGLAISKLFVELMHGKIWAESTPGSGTTMHFTAQFSVVEGAAVGEVAGQKPSAENGTAPVGLRPRALRVLLADDSEENRFLICGYLENSGCVIDEVENGALAVERFKQRSYDVVLIDSEMPVLDGYSATREMRAFERERASTPTPIFALTAHALREAQDRSAQAGCTEHLTKPIQKATLLEAINKWAPGALPSDRVQVSVEPWLKPVVAGYLEKRRSDIAKLQGALDCGDFATIATLGHQMNGTGAAYGFEPITEIGTLIEAAARSSDTARIRESIDDLDRYLRDVQVD